MVEKSSFIWLIGLLILSTLLIAPSVSAWTSDSFIKDDVKSIEKEDAVTNWGKYEIIEHAWWDVLKIWTEEKIKEVELIENTPECSNDCLAIKEITNLKPAPLIEDVRFLRDFGNGKFVAWNGFTNWRVLVEEDVEQFETICKDAKEIIDEKNKTSYFEQDCSQISTGFVKQWLPLDFKKNYEGTYLVKLEGGKKESTRLDWQVKINGYWTEEWAVWGNISLGDDAEVILNSPTDGSTPLTNPVTFNASANVTGGAYLTNMSFCSNITGSWGCGDSVDLSLNMTQGLVTYLKLDEASGTLVDDKGLNNFTASGSPLYSQTGIIDTAVGFNSNDDYFQKTSATGVNFGTTADFTVNFWTDGSTPSSADTNYFSSRSTTETQPWYRAYYDGTTLYYEVASGGGADRVFFASNQTVVDGNWHMITMRRSNSGLTHQLFVDGVLAGQSTGTTKNAASGTFILGDSRADRHLNGKLDEFGIWNRSLTNNELLNLYNSGEARRPQSGDLSYTNTWLKTIPAGSTLWNVQACDTDGDCGFSVANYTVSLDADAPTITILGGSGIQNYGTLTQNHTITYFVNDTNLASCWIEYNGTNRTDNCVNAVPKYYNFTMVKDLYNLKVWANDTAGNVQSQVVSWDYYVFENSFTYASQALEGSTENFQANLSLTSGYRLSTAQLVYNGTSYFGTVTEPTTGNYIISRNITIPDVSNSTNMTFYWSMLFENSQVINTTTNTQEVLVLQIDNCTLYTNQIFNLTMVDESTQAFINGTTQNTSIKLSVQLSSLDGSTQILSFSKEYAKQNPARVCVSENFITSRMYMDAVIEYSSADRFIEFYNIQKYLLTNTTQSQNITLYNLKTSEGQEFKVTYKGLDFVPVANVIIQIQRKYIEQGVFKTVEIPMSGTNGFTIAHLVPNDVIYNLIFIKDGAILDTFTDVIATCQNPTFTECTINLNALITGTDLFDLVEEDDFFSSLSYNKNTRTISSTYGITSGTSGTTQLQVTLMDNLGTTSVCNDTLVGAGGTLSCIVPEGIGNSSIRAVLSLNGEIRREGFINMRPSPKEQYAGSIIFIAIVMLLFLLGIGVQENPMIMGVFLVFGLMVLTALNLVYSTSWIGAGATILWFVIAVVLVLVKGGNKR